MGELDNETRRAAWPGPENRGYLQRIRQGKVLTANGRPIPASQDIPGFCYVPYDLTESVRQRCEAHDATLTHDKFGYFFYHKSLRAFVEVISFDRLVNAAKERNKAFFDKLGLPTTKMLDDFRRSGE